MSGTKMPRRVTILNYDAALRQDHPDKHRPGCPGETGGIMRHTGDLLRPQPKRRVEYLIDHNEDDISPSESASQLATSRGRRRRRPHRAHEHASPHEHLPSTEGPGNKPIAVRADATSSVASPSVDKIVTEVLEGPGNRPMGPIKSKKANQSQATATAASSHAATVETVSETSSTADKQPAKPRLVEVSYRHIVHVQSYGRKPPALAPEIDAKDPPAPQDSVHPQHDQPQTLRPLVIDITEDGSAEVARVAPSIVELETPSLLSVQTASRSISSTSSHSQAIAGSKLECHCEPKTTQDGQAPAVEDSANALTVAAVESLNRHSAGDIKSSINRVDSVVDTVKSAQNAALSGSNQYGTQVITFIDAVNRKFTFPFTACNTWKSMQSLVQQAFRFVEVIGHRVMQGHYDLVGPGDTIILPSVWDMTVKPDWQVRMLLWPVPDIVELARSTAGTVIMSDHAQGLSAHSMSGRPELASEVAVKSVVESTKSVHVSEVQDASSHVTFAKSVTQASKATRVSVAQEKCDSTMAHGSTTARLGSAADLQHDQQGSGGQPDVEKPAENLIQNEPAIAESVLEQHSSAKQSQKCTSIIEKERAAVAVTTSEDRPPTEKTKKSRKSSKDLQTQKSSPTINIRNDVRVYLGTDGQSPKSRSSAAPAQRSSSAKTRSTPGSAAAKAITDEAACVTKPASLPSVSNTKAPSQCADKAISNDQKSENNGSDAASAETHTEAAICEQWTLHPKASTKSHHSAQSAVKSAVPTITVEPPNDEANPPDASNAASGNGAAKSSSSKGPGKSNSSPSGKSGVASARSQNDAAEANDASECKCACKGSSKSVKDRSRKGKEKAIADADGDGHVNAAQSGSVQAENDAALNAPEASKKGSVGQASKSSGRSKTAKTGGGGLEVAAATATAAAQSEKAEVVNTGQNAASGGTAALDAVGVGESAAGTGSQRGAGRIMAVAEEEYRTFRRRQVEVPPLTAWVVGNTYHGPGFPRRR